MIDYMMREIHRRTKYVDDIEHKPYLPDMPAVDGVFSELYSNRSTGTYDGVIHIEPIKPHLIPAKPEL